MKQNKKTKLDTLLSSKQISSLEHSIAESYRDEDIMDISEAKQMHTRWLIGLHNPLIMLISIMICGILLLI